MWTRRIYHELERKARYRPKAVLWNLEDKILIETDDENIAIYIATVLGAGYREQWGKRFRYVIELKKSENEVANELRLLRAMLAIRDVI